MQKSKMDFIYQLRINILTNMVENNILFSLYCPIVFIIGWKQHTNRILYGKQPHNHSTVIMIKISVRTHPHFSSQDSKYTGPDHYILTINTWVCCTNTPHMIKFKLRTMLIQLSAHYGPKNPNNQCPSFEAESWKYRSC